ncbi:MAG: rod shape-determining protein MreC [Novosphingobium sp.]
MAPSSNRRPGSSRRAQYSTFLGYVIAFLGVAVGVAVLLISTGNAGAFSSLRSSASDVVAPAAEAAAVSRSEGQGLFAALKGYFTYGVRVARNEQELDEARVKLAEAAALKDENRRLKALVDLMDVDPKPVAVARLIGSTSSSTRRFALLGAGRQQGVAVGMPVRSPLGLVGRVLETGDRTARVLLITDTESVVPVRRASDGVPAFATGRGDGTLQLRLINLGTNPLKVGDAFVTSGSGGLYWPDTAIAVVTRLTRDGAIARALSDPGTTEFVQVQPLWEEGTAAQRMAVSAPVGAK